MPQFPARGRAVPPFPGGTFPALSTVTFAFVAALRLHGTLLPMMPEKRLMSRPAMVRKARRFPEAQGSRLCRCLCLREAFPTSYAGCASPLVSHTVGHFEPARRQVPVEELAHGTSFFFFGLMHRASSGPGASSALPPPQPCLCTRPGAASQCPRLDLLHRKMIALQNCTRPSLIAPLERPFPVDGIHRLS